MAKPLIDLTLKERADSIMATNDGNLYKITATIKSFNEESNFEDIEVLFLKRIHILKDFSNCFADEIVATFSIRPEQYTSVLQNYKDIEFVLETVSINTASLEDNADAEIRKFIMVFNSKVDTTMITSKAEREETDEQYTTEKTASNMFDVEVQLIEKEIYKARKQQINAILTNVTIADVIRFITSQLGFKKLKMKTPDNTKVYSNFIIPLGNSLTGIFGHLQSYYGVYNDGFGYYYHEETLWIYPLYEEAPEWYLDTVHFYKVPVNYYAGSDSYHAIEDDEYHIVIDTAATHKSLGENLSENVGNILMVHNTELSLDQFRTITENGNVFREDPVETFYNDTQKTNQTNTARVEYLKSKSNPFVLKSQLSAMDVEVIGFKWPKAIPFIFGPGQRIRYHYDGDDGYSVRDAAGSYIEYEIVPDGQLTERRYTCTATIMITLKKED